MKAAIFDLDGTLLPMDAERSWIEYVGKMSGIDMVPVKKELDHLYETLGQDEKSYEAYSDFTMKFLARFQRSYLDIYLDEYIKRWVAPQVKESAKALIQKHKDAGDIVVLCTAAYSYIAAPIAALFGITNLLSPVPKEDEKGEFVGVLDGTHNFGSEKARRILDFIKIQKMFCGRPIDFLTVYSDSIRDRAMFELAERLGGVCVATNADAALRTLAHEKGWKTMDLFEKEDWERALSPLVV